MRYVIGLLRYDWELLKWIWSSPSIAAQILRGWDKQTRDIIFERWMERAPKREAYLPLQRVPVQGAGDLRLPRNPLIVRRGNDESKP